MGRFHIKAEQHLSLPGYCATSTTFGAAFKGPGPSGVTPRNRYKPGGLLRQLGEIFGCPCQWRNILELINQSCYNNGEHGLNAIFLFKAISHRSRRKIAARC